MRTFPFITVHYRSNFESQWPLCRRREFDAGVVTRTGVVAGLEGRGGAHNKKTFSKQSPWIRRVCCVCSGNDTERFQWVNPALAFSFSRFSICSQFWFQGKITACPNSAVRPEVCPVWQPINVEIAHYYCHLLLSTKNSCFKNSIFLIMPNIMRKKLSQ